MTGAIVTEIARAKVNLTLRVLGRRPDGYHELVSLVAFADMGDEVTLERAGPPSVEVTGPFAGEIVGTNLITNALDLLAAAEPRLALGRVTLDKRLPVAAGIGGGSADAAAMLRAVRRFNPSLANNVDWLGFAARLGADVPVCLESHASIMAGVGERLSRCDIPKLQAVLVNPRAPVPADKTRRVFQALKLKTASGSADPEPPRQLDRAALIALMRRDGNDLEDAAAAVLPAITAVKAALQATPGLIHAQLSGAGPTCFGIYESSDAARAAAQELAMARPDWWLLQTTLS